MNTAFQTATFENERGPSVSARVALAAAIADHKQVDLSWIESPPTDDGWCLAMDALRFLTSIVGHFQPKHILEFGSGLSTRVLARAAGKFPYQGYISSIDHDPEFAATASEAYTAHSEPKVVVCFHVAPLVARDYGGKLVPVYLIPRERFASDLSVDLAVIDGPTVALGGREGTLYQIMEFARPGTLVLLDDAARREERMALRNWKDNLGEAIEIVPLQGFAKGMAAIIIHEPVRRSELWDHRLSLTRREIEELIQPDETFILAGDCWWREQLGARRRSVPFPEHHGEYWGPPANDISAIQELESLRRSGCEFVVFGWNTFWWLDYYSDFRDYLNAEYRCALSNDCVVAFDLRGHRAITSDYCKSEGTPA